MTAARIEVPDVVRRKALTRGAEGEAWPAASGFPS